MWSIRHNLFRCLCVKHRCYTYKQSKPLILSTTNKLRVNSNITAAAYIHSSGVVANTYRHKRKPKKNARTSNDDIKLTDVTTPATEQEKQGYPLIVEMLAKEQLADLVAQANDSENLSNFQELETLLNTKVEIADAVISEDFLHLEETDEELHNSATINNSIFKHITETSGVSPGETIILDTPKQKLMEMELDKGPDPTEPLSKIPCSGCGANLHCQDPGVPGYMPGQKYKLVPKHELRDNFCQRCHLMRTYNIALNASVKPEEYEAIISKIKGVQALTILIVDIMDIPNSLFKGLPKLIGRKRPLFILGNKIDLLPKDDRGYLNHAREMLERMCQQEGLYDEMYVHHVGLISAKTGYGVEELITKLFKNWGKRGHVYLLGCTNVGKSTLFNTLLSSDYCKARARDFIHRSTTSVWPGTTLNMLKFPILSPMSWRMVQRTERLKADRLVAYREAKLQKQISYSKLTNHTLNSHIGQTFLSNHDSRVLNYDDEELTGATYSFSTKKNVVSETSRDKDHLREDVLGEKEVFDETLYNKSWWCYDTPGVVNPDQIINLLNQKELVVSQSNHTLKPRTFIVKPSQVLFLSGLGRLDYLQGRKSIYMTVVASHRLPVHVINGNEADEFYAENIGTNVLGIPVGDQERLWQLPSLVGRQFDLVGTGWDNSVADVMLSSLGWVAITAGVNMDLALRAYTPGGLGCGLRLPALLRYAVNLRGARIGGSSAYKLRSSKPKTKDRGQLKE